MDSITTAIFSPGDRVTYIPNHASDDIDHPDVERGKVSSINTKFVFVRFDKQVAKFGWDGTTSQACLPENLMKETP